MRRRCLGGCGRLIAKGSYCPECKPNGHWSPNRDRTAQARMRRQLIKMYGERCMWIDGQRCPATTDLRACHIVPLRDGGSYEVSNGVLLCKTHDKATDRYAR